MTNGCAAVIRLAAALVLVGISVGVQDDTGGVAVYGSEGGLSQVRPRIEGGWPAPFLADDPATSVPHKLGAEDVFRPGAFLADLAFWYLLVGAFLWLLRRR
ncbi:hypothetical protein [Sphingomonas sp. Mn802worker]|uniref:hypothetical protein n=1 Tax=Sphingomonas sp. Mn802worker TaxID=629773 RepID=UPI00039D59AC|nr:hypothetical protein [Sphingomonas sp. Mn802worker]